MRFFTRRTRSEPKPEEESRTQRLWRLNADATANPGDVEKLRAVQAAAKDALVMDPFVYLALSTLIWLVEQESQRA